MASNPHTSVDQAGEERPAAGALRVLLFDVGGVLVRIDGVQEMLGWLGQRIPEEELWRQWLRSPAVRSFETGRIGPDQFARGVIAEFGVDVSPQRFLASFDAWPTGLYPGTIELLQQIPRRYRRALLSNNNTMHWPRLMVDMGLGAHFDALFPSHLTGYIKPDIGAFRHVIQALGVQPSEVLFLDDNLPNVEGGRAAGMQAVQVRGLEQARQALVARGILPG